MAGTETRPPMCRYFRLGKCTRGASCPYSHDLSHPDSFICPYFLQGNCKYGDSCMYDHKLPGDEAHPPASQGWAIEPDPLSANDHSTGFQSQNLSPSMISWRTPPSREQVSEHQWASSPSSSHPWQLTPEEQSALEQQRPCPSVTASWLSKGLDEPINEQQWSSQGTAETTQPSTFSAHDAADTAQSHLHDDDQDSRPPCIYFQKGACQFGDNCRFRHVLLEDPALVSPVATVEHVTRTMVNLRTLEATDALAGDCDGTNASSSKTSDKLVPPKTESVWQAGKLSIRKQAAAPQATPAPPPPPNLPDASTLQYQGFVIQDDNEDLLDPWTRTQHPESIPLRETPAVGDECEYAGIDPSQMMCSEFCYMGQCSAGAECKFMHGEFCHCCGLHCLHPTDEQARTEHEEMCIAMAEEAERQRQRMEVMNKKECGICLEPVLRKEDASARRFGLLACDHCYCLQCIRGWRANEFADVTNATRTCPECRVTAHFVTPSSVWPETKEEKDTIIDEYKRQLSQKHCKHFDRGRGTCPFGTSCFYRHEFEDGTLQDRTNLDDVRFVTDSNGEWTSVRENTLASFLETDRASRLLRQGRRRGR